MAKELTGYQQKVLICLSRCPGAGSVRVAEMIGAAEHIEIRNAENAIRSLTRLGMLDENGMLTDASKQFLAATGDSVELTKQEASRMRKFTGWDVDPSTTL